MKTLRPRFLLVLLSLVAAFDRDTVRAADAKPRPNILWLTTEDIGPQLGCYGDKYADTPNLDRFAQRSVRYRHAWSNAPVCAPARTTIITGLYPPSIGAEHMRSQVRLPAALRLYPQHLRDAGYYCSNNSKEDYNLEKTGKVWDDSSNKAHWKNRAPGQPFFAIFNFTGTHESQIRRKGHTLVHDPAKARIPAYHPDTPEVRRDWAQYYDNITTMDGMFAKSLAELTAAGLADDTIVFFYGDHGSGMPRSKRWPYNSGLQVPLLVHIPEKFKHLRPADYAAGGTTDRLVSFVDLAPTLLSLIGVKSPETFQGHAFLGEFAAAPQPFIYGFRGRMDERHDLVRSVRDERYVYIRNYMPHLPYGQHISYMFETPTTVVWKKLFDAGKLNAAQSTFWKAKAPEELYDLQSDPDEVSNLAASPAHTAILERLREAQRGLARKIRDVGFLPEGEIHSRAQDSSAYEVGHDDAKYPFQRVFDTAEIASSLKPDATPALLKALADTDSAVRYWGVMGLLMRGPEGVNTARVALRQALADAAPPVRITAARALATHGNAEDLGQALPVLETLAPLGKNDVYTSVLALNAIDALGGKAASLRGKLSSAGKGEAKAPPRMQSYVPRLLEHINGASN